MVQTTQRRLDPDCTASVRALSSITKRDAAAVRATVRSTGNLYGVEEHDDYDGYLSIILTPPHEGGPAFLISGRAGAIDLAALHGDEMVQLGRFPSIGAAMLTLRPALALDGHDEHADAAAQRLVHRHGGDADIHAAMRADGDNGDRWRAVIRAIDRRHDIS